MAVPFDKWNLRIIPPLYPPTYSKYFIHENARECLILINVIHENIRQFIVSDSIIHIVRGELSEPKGLW